MVRIYCLSSISKIAPSVDYDPPIPYDEGADEIILNENGYHSVMNRDEFSPEYLLTEICIGWNAIGDGTKKVYELQIYRPNGMLLNFIMVRGIATVENMDLNNGSFELHLATSKFFTFSNTSSPNFDLKIKVIFVKNTKVRKIITNEEELAYNDYAEKISIFCSDNAINYLDLSTLAINYPHSSMEDLQMEAIRKLGPLNLPNQSKPKFLKQKLRDFQQAIYLLCNPENGSFANIPVNEYDPETKKSKVCRFYQQVECLLFLRQSTWYGKETRAIKQQKDKFSECIHLDWANTNLRNLDFAFQNLRAIDFDNVDLGESLKYWHTFAANVNFKEITSMSIRNCGIKKLDDEFFKHFSRDMLNCLSFINNDIQHISKVINRLEHLSILDLSGNKNLSEDGITWYLMPPNLQVLNLENTNINIIPEEIWWIKSLSDFKVSSSGLKNISWCDFNKNIKKLSITGGGNEVNEVELSHLDDVEQLIISNLKINKIDYFSLPICVTSLHLIDTHLGKFDTHDIQYSNRNFDELTLSGNDLTEFSWEGCPKAIKRLILSNNQFKDISIKDSTLNFRDFVELTELSFQKNKISSLPEGFENLQQLSTLNLSQNCFNYDESDLMDVLWHRLPTNLISLNLNNNNIVKIPCLLKHYNIRNLHVAGCNLNFCCPYLHIHIQKNEDYMVIDASDNPNFILSFIPSRIFKLPKVSEIKQTIGKPLYHQNLIPNYANFSTTTLKGNFCDTSKTLYSKAAFQFRLEGIEQNDTFACKCCGMCGNATDEPLFQQQMAPDSILLIQEGEGKEDTKTTNYHCPFKPPIYYKPGQWRTQIKSRLCCSCKKVLLEKINEAFDTKTKKKKVNNANVNDDIHEESSHELPRKSNRHRNFKNMDDEAMEIQQEIPPRLLPPIETLYFNNGELRYDFSTSDFSLPQSFERTVLIDRDGRECARWEHPYSYNNYSDLQTYDHTNVQYPSISNNETDLLFDNSNFETSDEMLYWCNL